MMINESLDGGTLGAFNSSPASVIESRLTGPSNESWTIDYEAACNPTYETTGDFLSSPLFHSVVSIMYGVVFLLALTGNGLVCFIVQTSPRMKTVTNYFIVNLAVGDILLTLFCVPFTFVSMLVLRYWPFGAVMCKVVNYSQAVSVLVSAYTLVAISMDRYMAIMHPLKPRLGKTAAKFVVAAVWLGALATAAPIAIVSQLRKPTAWHMNCDAYVCLEVWARPAQSSQYTFALLGLQFALPLGALVCTYARIAHVVLLGLTASLFVHRYVCLEVWARPAQSSQYTFALLGLQFALPLGALVCTYARIAHVVLLGLTTSLFVHRYVCLEVWARPAQSSQYTFALLGLQFALPLGALVCTYARIAHMVLLGLTASLFVHRYVCLEVWARPAQSSQYTFALLGLQFALPLGALVCTYARIAHVVLLGLTASLFVHRYVCLEVWARPAQRSQYTFALLGLQFALPLGALVCTYARIAHVVLLGLTTSLFVHRYVCLEVWARPAQSSQYTFALLGLQFALPLGALVCTYARIAHVVWGGRPPGEAHCARDSRMQRSKRKMVKMMVTVVAVFTVCWLPLNVFIVLWTLHAEDEAWGQWWGVPYVWFASHWLAMSHSCYNPVIYCYMNLRYRRGFQQILSCIVKSDIPMQNRSSGMEGIPMSEMIGPNGIERRGTSTSSNSRLNRMPTCSSCTSDRRPRGRARGPLVPTPPRALSTRTQFN